MPRPRTVPDDELYDRLASIFRTAGFEGASLGALAEAGMLQRASLYHRFPGGKAEMAEAVLRRVGTLFTWAVAPLTGADGELADDVRECGRRLHTLYDGGALPCVMDTLTLSGSPGGVRAAARDVAALWIDGMAAGARRAGMDAEQAATRAREAFTRLEGGLVYSRLFDDAGEFERALAELPRRLGAA